LSVSHGAISKPAVQALPRGCASAGIWMNTGEGGLAIPFAKAGHYLQIARRNLASG
jgi:glutamate synthase domain-containing protein 2